MSQGKKEENANTANTTKNTIKTKRAICQRCKRPAPSACICPSLPDEPLAPFQKCRVIVLQHPHELRRKNRSLPLIELCLQGGHYDSRKHNDLPDSSTINESAQTDFSIQTVIGRRLGDKTPKDIMSLIQKPNALLLYPDDSSVSLEEGLKLIKERSKTTSKSDALVSDETNNNSDKVECDQNINDEKVTLIFIDATWKYAKEMERKNTIMNLWPKDLIRVKLSPSSSTNDTEKDTKTHVGKIESPLNNKSSHNENKNENENENENEKTAKVVLPSTYKPRRFDIRTPPSENHLSTAECIAWVVSAIEEDGSIYETLMKPLDYMVKLWHSFDTNRGNGWIDKNDKRKKTDANGREINIMRKRHKLFSD